MSRIVQKLLDSLKLTDEDDEFDDDEFEEEDEEISDTVTKRESPHLRKYDAVDEDEDDSNEDEDDDADEAAYPQRRTFTAKPKTQQTSSFVPRSKTAVPLRSTIADRRIYVLNPKSFEDAQEVCETLKSGGVIFLNFEGVKYELAQRLMDFAGGSVYALGGQIYQITGFSFIIAPGDTDIEGDILAQITSAGNEFPTFTKY